MISSITFPITFLTDRKKRAESNLTSIIMFDAFKYVFYIANEFLNIYTYDIYIYILM